MFKKMFDEGKQKRVSQLNIITPYVGIVGSVKGDSLI
jgi:hypothetical protein